MIQTHHASSKPGPRSVVITRDDDAVAWAGLVAFIADGERSEYIVTTRSNLEVQANTQRAAIERVQREAQEARRRSSRPVLDVESRDLH